MACANRDRFVVQLTDTHLLEDPDARLYDVSPDTQLARVLDHLETRFGLPDAIVATGDLSEDASEAAYRRLRTRLQTFGAPAYVLPGNHDDPARMARLFANDPVRMAPDARLGDWRLLFLDTTVPNATWGRLSAAALDRLEHTLTAHPDQPALVFCHHPPVPVGTAWMDRLGLRNGQDLLRRLENHPQVRAVAWGHTHQASEARHGPLALLGTPATVMQFRPGSRQFALDDAPPGLRWFRLGARGDFETGVERVPA